MVPRIFGCWKVQLSLWLKMTLLEEWRKLKKKIAADERKGRNFLKFRLKRLGCISLVWAQTGIEPMTSRTQSENHTTRTTEPQHGTPRNETSLPSEQLPSGSPCFPCPLPPLERGSEPIGAVLSVSPDGHNFCCGYICRCVVTWSSLRFIGLFPVVPLARVCGTIKQGSVVQRHALESAADHESACCRRPRVRSLWLFV